MVWSGVVRMYSVEMQVAPRLSAGPGTVIGVSICLQYFLVHFCPASINCSFTQRASTLYKFLNILQMEWWIRPCRLDLEWVSVLEQKRPWVLQWLLQWLGNCGALYCSPQHSYTSPLCSTATINTNGPTPERHSSRPSPSRPDLLYIVSGHLQILASLALVVRL